MYIHKKLIAYALNVQGYFPSLLVLSLLLALVAVLQMFVLSVIISQVFIQHILPSQTLFLFLLASIVLRGCLIWLRERYSHVKGIEIRSGIRQNLLNNVLERGGNHVRQGNTGELVALVTEGVDKLDDYYVKYIPSAIYLAVFPVVILIFVLWYDLISGIVLLITGPLIVFFMWLIGTHAKMVTRKQWEAMSTLTGYFLDVIQGIKTLKIHNAGKREAKNVYAESNAFRVLTMRVLKIAFLSGFVLELAASISIAMVALQVSIRMIEGLMVFQTGLFMLLLAPEYFLPFRLLGANHHAGMEGVAAAAKIFEFEAPDTRVVGIKDHGQEKFESIKIDFIDVEFSYPGAEQPALLNISCTLESGTITAAVGSTGAGKTTFANLLLKFICPGKGIILVNGIILENIASEYWHKNIAYVSQKPHFFNASILENMQMANNEAGMETIIEAARLAGIHDTIMGWPDNYQTLITENAAGISAGEKQRLAIARAFLKNAPLLTMDEPTSNLDPHSEQVIAHALRQLTKGRTTLIIAHRLKTVMQADHILVFDKGSIAEQGNHVSLLSLKGKYAGLLGANPIPNHNG